MNIEGLTSESASGRQLNFIPGEQGYIDLGAWVKISSVDIHYWLGQKCFILQEEFYKSAGQVLNGREEVETVIWPKACNRTFLQGFLGKDN